MLYWDEKIDVSKEKYQNLTQDEVAMLLADPEVEVVNQKTTEVAPAGVDEMGMMIPPIFSYDVKLKKTKKTGSCC